MKNVHSLYSVLTMKYKIWGYYINLMNFWFTFNMSAKTSELLFCIHTLVKSIVITMSIKFFNQSVIVIILIFLKLWDSLHDIPLWGPQDGKSTCWNSPHTGPWHPLSLWSCGLMYWNENHRCSEYDLNSFLQITFIVIGWIFY